MEFGYSSSASNSPEHPAFVLPYMNDSTPDSSGPTSPDEIKQMLVYNPAAPYNAIQNSGSYPSIRSPDTNTIPVEFTYAVTISDDHNRRKRGPGNTAKDKGNVSSMHMRRRAQNRASQRAFRERKEKHLKGLEYQLTKMHGKHQDLVESYMHQTEEVAKLNARIQELASELEALRNANEKTFNDMIMPDTFDAGSGLTNLYRGPDVYFDKGVTEVSGDASRDDDLI